MSTEKKEELLFRFSAPPTPRIRPLQTIPHHRAQRAGLVLVSFPAIIWGALRDIPNKGGGGAKTGPGGGPGGGGGGEW